MTVRVSHNDAIRRRHTETSRSLEDFMRMVTSASKHVQEDFVRANDFSDA